MAEKIEQKSRRDFLKKAGYTAPAILTISAAPAFARHGSCPKGPKRPKGPKGPRGHHGPDWRHGRGGHGGHGRRGGRGPR